MISINNFHFSWMGLFLTLVMGILLYLGMSPIKRYMTHYSSLQKSPRPTKILPFLIWITFVITALMLIFQSFFPLFLILGFLLISTCFWVFWFIIQDLVAGMIFKWHQDFQTGHEIKINQTLSGSIAQLGWLGLYLNQEQDHRLRIPYHKIVETVVISNFRQESVFQHRFSVSIQADKTHEAEQSLHKALLLTPGLCLKRKPEIHLLQTVENEHIFEVLIHMLGSQYSKPIKDHIQYEIDCSRKKH